MKKYVLLLSVFSLFGYLSLQAQQFDWLSITGNTDYETIASITTDSAGNVISTGTFKGTVDFDPGPSTYNLTSKGQYWNMYIQKLDPNGNFLWAINFRMDGQSFIRPTGIKTGPLGTIYAVGSVTAQEGPARVDFDPGPDTVYLATATRHNSFYLKLDTDGNYEWLKYLSYRNNGNQPGLPRTLGLVVDRSGSLIAHGEFTGGTIDFDPGPSSNTLTPGVYTTGFIQKLDANGDFVWAGKIGGDDVNNPGRIAIDKDDNILLTGRFAGTGDFDPGAGTITLSGSLEGNCYFVKLAPDGNAKWAFQFGDQGSTVGTAISSDLSGNVYLTGLFSYATIDADPGPRTRELDHLDFDVSGPTVFVIKLDSVGNYVWANRFGPETGPNFDPSGTAISSEMLVDNQENVYIVGSLIDSINFDPDGRFDHYLASNGKRDVFVQKLDQRGDFVWATHLGGTEAMFVKEAAMSSPSQIHIAGSFDQTVDFDPGQGTQTATARGANDSFILTLKGDFNVSNEPDLPQLHIEAFPNPSNGSFSVDVLSVTGNVRLDIIDAQGKTHFLNTLLGGTKHVLNLKHLTSGVYWMRITHENGSQYAGTLVIE